MAAVNLATLIGALSTLARAGVHLLGRVLRPLIGAYHDHQTQQAEARLAAAVERGDLDGARHARRRLLDLKAARERLR